MSVTRDDVRHIAALARLELEPEELARMTEQLNDILAYFSELQATDAGGVEPFHGAAEGTAEPRDDVPGAAALHVDPLVLSPASHDGFFTVPRLAAQQP